MRGFGFRSPEAEAKGIFVHATSLERSSIGPLSDGDRFRLEIEDDSRASGKHAARIKLSQVRHATSIQ